MQTRVAFLWHMHQPMYVDATSGEAILPWVRLHATHSYYDMARILGRHPGIRATVNFVPSLVQQLQAIADGSLRERYLDISRKPPGEMSREERLFVVRQFFMVDRERSVRPVPRYAELLAKRGEDPNKIDPDAFPEGDLRDLQVLFNLAWMGFSARKEESAVAALLEKGRDFTEDDKHALLDAQQRIVQKVIPIWKQLASTGRIELSSTPCFHPILPLLCDSDSAKRAMPNAVLPPRFSWPADARLQVRMALDRHEKAFGQRPAGMWPAEGSVSPEALAVLAGEGVRWVATDQEILFRSTPAPTQHGALYQAWDCEAGERRIGLLFRDHELSDRVGFTYVQMRSEDAANDFLAQVRRASQNALADDVAAPIVPVILDGENAWEHYERQGEAFLDAMYGQLEHAADLATVTMSEALADPTGHLTRIHTGSWIDANFRIWIGHPEDNLAWELLGKVRAMLDVHEKKGDIPGERLEEARQCILAAEGSDWFWWYGDDFETDNASELDALFRQYVLKAASLLGEEPPARLHEPISAQANRQREKQVAFQPPTALIHPAIDGRNVSYLRWVGAGSFRADGAKGAMYRSSALVSAVRYGFDDTQLYLRLDPVASVEGLVLTVWLTNDHGSTHEVHIPLKKGALDMPLPGAKGAFEDVIELGLPLQALGLVVNDRARLELRFTRDDNVLERIPAQGALAVDIPGPDFVPQTLWA